MALVITQCCMQALYDMGAEGQGAVDLAKGFERRKCNHFKVRPQDECMNTMAGALSCLVAPLAGTGSSSLEAREGANGS